MADAAFGSGSKVMSAVDISFEAGILKDSVVFEMQLHGQWCNDIPRDLVVFEMQLSDKTKDSVGFQVQLHGPWWTDILNDLVVFEMRLQGPRRYA